jgi:hypothetical protein
MGTRITRLFLSATVGLITFTSLPPAWAGGRMGMMGARPQVMMTSRMMTPNMMTPNTMTPNMMTPNTMTSRMSMGSMTTGNMTGNMMNGNMMNGNIMTTTPFTNGFGFGNQGFGSLGMRWPWWSGMGGYGGGYGGGGYGGGGYGSGYGGYDLSSLYANPYQATDSSASSKKRQKPDPIPTLTPEQERELVQRQNLAWSRSELAENETTSATALNILLTDLQKRPSRNPNAADVRLDPAILASINVVVATTNGNIGVLKHGGQIPWTALLREPEFNAERQRIDALAIKAIDEAIDGKSVNVQDLSDALASLQRHLADKIQEVPTPEYIRAKRLLDHLDDAVKVLREPDAGNYFNQVYIAKGQTVSELVRYMTRANLRLAPAMAGDEAAYLSLQRALAEYDLAAQAQSLARK